MNTKANIRIFSDYIAPYPNGEILWMDMSEDPNGSIVKFWNGIYWKPIAGLSPEEDHADVIGPGYSQNNNVATFDGNTGKLIKDSGKSLNDFQIQLISGQTIKTINGNSILGSGNIFIEGSGGGIDVSSLVINNKHFVNNIINLVKSDIGLSNVDNTSDINKPISTAVQNALNSIGPINRQYSVTIDKDDILWEDGWISMPSSIVFTTYSIEDVYLEAEFGYGTVSLSPIIHYRAADAFNGATRTGFLLRDTDGLISENADISYIKIEYNAVVDGINKYDSKLYNLGENIINNHNAHDGWHSEKNQIIIKAACKNIDIDIDCIKSYLDPISNYAIVGPNFLPTYCEEYNANMTIVPYVDSSEWMGSAGNPNVLSITSHFDNVFRQMDITPRPSSLPLGTISVIDVSVLEFIPDCIAVSARNNDTTTQEGTSFGFGLEFSEDLRPEALDPFYPERNLKSDIAAVTTDVTGTIVYGYRYTNFTQNIVVGDKFTRYIGDNEEVTYATEILNGESFRCSPAFTPSESTEFVIWIDVTLAGYCGAQQQSWAVPLIGGKLKTIKLSTGANWQIIREAARATAYRAGVTDGSKWDIYRGFGTINVADAIQYVQENYSDNLQYRKNVADKLPRMDSFLTYDDLNQDNSITKKFLEEKINTSGGISLGETSTTAYRGDRGKTAYDHSQIAHAPSNAEQNVNSDWNAVSGDARILNKPTIPTNTNQLTNGAGFLTSETDPTVPSWAKQTNKPSYNNSEIVSYLGFTPESISNKNQSNGYAPLDSGGKVPLANLPSTLLKYIGQWDTSTNIPTLTNPDVTKKGNVYDVSVGGTIFGLTFKQGDWLIYNDSGVPEKSDNSDEVTSVNGLVGAVTVTTNNVTEVTNRRYQTDNQQYYNDATSSIQTQLNGKQPITSVLTNTTASYTTTIDSRLANTSGTNTGDNAANSLYSGLVSFPGFGTSHSTAAYGDHTHYADTTKSDKLITFVQKTASFNLADSDSDVMLNCEHATVPIVVTVPTGLTTGKQFFICQNGAAQVSVGVSGTTAKSDGSKVIINAQNGVAQIIIESSTTFKLFGDLK